MFCNNAVNFIETNAGITMQDFFRKRKTLLFHIGFWAVYFSFFFYQMSFRMGREKSIKEAFVEASLHVLFVIIIAYVNYSFLFPKYMRDKKLLPYILSFVFFFALDIGIYTQIKKAESVGTRAYEMFSSNIFLIHHSVTVLFIVVFITMLRFVEEWFGMETRKKELENENLNSELRFLKEQINPHFLFNTLNSLYYLATINSPNTPEVIMKLSQMMRYMLYDSNRSKVPLTQEIEYMKNYIELEKMRIENEVPINLSIEGNVAEYNIVPLVLNTFLENAFKHGLNNHTTDGFINISIKVGGGKLFFVVENSKPVNPDRKEKSGIGLPNVERRLDLSYPEKYNLEVNETETAYKVNLTMTLK